MTATPSIASASSEIVNTFASRSVGTVYFAAFNSFGGVSLLGQVSLKRGKLVSPECLQK